MALSIRELKRRIKSVEGTKKMTRAMEMVAAAKLQRLRSLLAQADRYIGSLARILATLVREKPLAHPLLEVREEIKSTLVILISSDTGLCGSYNTNVLEQANRFVRESGDPDSIEFLALGKNGTAFLTRRGLKIFKSMGIPRPQAIEETVEEITNIAKDVYMSGRFDQVFFIHTHVASLAALKPRVVRLFPFTPKADADADPNAVVDYILEPSLTDVLDVLLPEYIQAEVAQSVKHSLVAEQASRMMAMRQASDNAKKMIDSLTLLRNKVRQASITKELIEVVSGSLAQKK